MTELERYIVRADEPASGVLARLHENRVAVGVVVDDRDTLLGTVSESGIRRTALADPALTRPVEELMTRRPLVVEPSASDEEVRALLTGFRTRSVPVVDGGRVVGVRSIDEFPEHRPPAPIAVLMVGGRGERLRPLTDKVPKPLLRIGATSIVERIIGALATAGVEEIHLAVNYLAEQFEEKLGDGSELGVRIGYLREKEPLGSAGPLYLLPEAPRAPVFVSNGDLVTTIDYGSLFDYHWHHAAAITVAGVEHLTHVPFGVLRTAEHHLLGIEEKPSRRDLVSAGMYVLEPETLRYVPPAAPFTMPELIDEVLAEGLPVHVYPILEGWFDIGSPEELERVMLMFATGEEE